MPAGKVKWFNNAKGYGFILAEGSEEDLFVHYSSIIMEGYKTLKAGQPVAFDTLQASKGIHAVNIHPCNTNDEAVRIALEMTQSDTESPVTEDENRDEVQRQAGNA